MGATRNLWEPLCFDQCQFICHLFTGAVVHSTWVPLLKVHFVGGQVGCSSPFASLCSL